MTFNRNIILSTICLILSLKLSFYGQTSPKIDSFSSSDLPIIVINTKNKVIVDSPKIVAEMGIIDNGFGKRNYLTDEFNDFKGFIGIEIRGATSQSFPKKQYGFETRDSLDSDIDVSLLGMPKENDWILSAPYSDKSLIRNALIYNLANQLGHYASRTRFCELVINNDYKGIYILMEKIKRDKNRVNISKLESDENSGDDLTGGYIIKLDKKVGDNIDGWHSEYPAEEPYNDRIFFQYHYPKPDKITEEQKNYIHNYINDFEGSLLSYDPSDSLSGFRKYIETDSFVDYFLLTELSKNIDGYRLSTFLYKDKESKGGKLNIGPIWDFNLAFGNADYYNGYNTTGWWKDSYYTGMKDIPFWWDILFKEEQFKQKVINRWQDLRKSILSQNNIYNTIDSLTTLLSESKDRNFSRWPIFDTYVWPNYFIGSNYEEEISYLKDWIKNRCDWMDEHIIMKSDNEVIDDEGEFALNFDGKGTYVNCGISEATNITGTSITIEAWINPNRWRTNPYQGVILANDNMGSGIDYGYVLRCGGDGKLEFILGDGGWHELHSSNNVLSLNEWNHVAATYDGSKMRLYVNGNLVKYRTDFLTISDSPKNLFIGSSPSDFTRSFSGKIDEVRIWNICRTEEEINTDRFVNIDASTYGLAAYWQFNEGRTQTVKDKCNNNDGCLGSMKYVEESDPLWTNSYNMPVNITENKMSIPRDFLKQNYPNPFNPSTTIEYQVSNDNLKLKKVKLVVFDILGRHIITLVDEYKASGTYKVQFNAQNISSGTYFYILRIDDFQQTNKLTIIK